MNHLGTALIDPREIFSRVGLSRGMRVADFGCGRTGHFVFLAAKIVEDVGIVYAVDILKEVLESIKNRIKGEGFDNIQTVWSDIEKEGKTPIPVNSLDICFFVNVMSQLKDQVSALQEAMRLLKTGGKIVIVDWAKKLGQLGPAETAILNQEKIKILCNSCALTLEETNAAGDYHFYSILRKV